MTTIVMTCGIVEGGRVSPEYTHVYSDENISIEQVCKILAVAEIKTGLTELIQLVNEVFSGLLNQKHPA